MIASPHLVRWQGRQLDSFGREPILLGSTDSMETTPNHALQRKRRALLRPTVNLVSTASADHAASLSFCR